MYTLFQAKTIYALDGEDLQCNACRGALCTTCTFWQKTSKKLAVKLLCASSA